MRSMLKTAASMAAVAACAPALAADHDSHVRGLTGTGVRADASDPAALANALNKAFDEFKAANDKRLSDLEKKMGDVIQDEKVDRINAAVTDMQAAMDALNLKLAADQTGGAGGADNPDVAAYATAFDRFFRRGVDANLRELAVKAALSTDSDPDGGYTVTPEMEQTIDRVLGTVSAMRSIAQVRQISTGAYKKLVNQGGAESGWVGERQQRTETATAKLAELVFNAMELYANPAATQTLLDDSVVDIAAWLSDEVSLTFAEQEGAAFVSGDGANKPRGILSYDTIADANHAWGKLGYIASGVAAALTDETHNGADALIDLVYSIKQGYRQNARFMMNRKTQAAVRKFKSATEELYLWQPSIQAGQPATVLGYPVTDDDNMSDVGANAFPIAFGDFRRGYLIVDRQGVRVLRDPYTNKPYVHFYTTKRVGGGVQNFEAIKLLKVAAT